MGMGACAKYIYFSALVLLGLSAVAQGELVETASFLGPKTTVKYALWGGAEEVTQARRYAQGFVKLHPEIRLDVNVYPWGQYWAKLQTQMASGLAPDVLQFYSGSFGVWVSRGALLPLDQQAKTDRMDFGDFFPVSISNCTWDGKLYALPTDIACWSIVYNKDLLQQSGQSFPSATQPMAWPDFLNLCKRLTLRNADGTYAQYGMSAGQNFNLTIAGKEGADFVDRPVNPTASRAATTEQSLVDLFSAEYAQGVILGAKPLAAGAFTVNSDTLLLNPKFAMGTTGPWALKELKDAGINFGVMPAPSGKSNHALINVNSVAVTAATKHPKEAWEFIKYMASKEVVSDRVSHLQGLPPRKSSVDSFLHNAYGIEGCEAFITDLEHASPTLTASSTGISKVRDDWLRKLEEKISAEQEIRLAALARPFTADLQKSFDEAMSAYIQRTVHAELPSLDKDLTTEIKKSGVSVNRPQDIPLGLWLWIPCGFIVLIRLAIRKEAPSKPTPHATWLLTPWLFGLFCFVLGPILAALILSLTDWNMIAQPNYVGDYNYIQLTGDPLFWLGLKTTFKYAALVVPISLCGGLFTAGLLSSGIKGADIFKAIIYLPALFTGAETAVLWTNMLNKQRGILNYLLSLIHVQGPDWMDSEHAFTSVVMMNLFWVGGAMIIYYAGMKQIPTSLYEAADLDGAKPARKFVQITIPMLSPVILFMVVMTTIGAFQVFTPALFFAPSSDQIGAPGDALRFYSVNIYDKAFNNLRMGEACCYSVVLFFIIFCITSIQLKLSQKFVYHEEVA